MDAKDLLQRIRSEWLTARDPVIVYRTGEFSKYEEQMCEHTTRMNGLMNEALSYIEKTSTETVLKCEDCKIDKPLMDNCFVCFTSMIGHVTKEGS